jgi:hypothetical protein
MNKKLKWSVVAVAVVVAIGAIGGKQKPAHTTPEAVGSATPPAVRPTDAKPVINPRGVAFAQQWLELREASPLPDGAAPRQPTKAAG